MTELNDLFVKIDDRRRVSIFFSIPMNHKHSTRKIIET